VGVYCNDSAPINRRRGTLAPLADFATFHGFA
jgi:hypothetical protein